MGKAIALLGEGNSCLTGPAGDILVAVKHDLRGERRMAAYFDGDVSPLGVQNVKGIVVAIGHRLLFLDVVIGADIPYLRLGTAGQPHHMSVVQRGVRSSELPPPQPETAWVMSHPEIRVQYDAINAVIAAAQEILIKSAQPVAHEGDGRYSRS